MGGVEAGNVTLQHGINVVGDGAVPPARLRELVQGDDAVLVEVECLVKRHSSENGGVM